MHILKLTKNLRYCDLDYFRMSLFFCGMHEGSIIFCCRLNK